MGRYALVDPENEVVVNVIIWDGESEYDPGEGLELVPLKDVDEEDPEPVAPGYGYNPRARKYRFTEPEPEPEEPAQVPETEEA